MVYLVSSVSSASHKLRTSGRENSWDNIRDSHLMQITILLFVVEGWGGNPPNFWADSDCGFQDFGGSRILAIFSKVFNQPNSSAKSKLFWVYVFHIFNSK